MDSNRACPATRQGDTLPSLREGRGTAAAVDEYAFACGKHRRLTAINSLPLHPQLPIYRTIPNAVAVVWLLLKLGAAAPTLQRVLPAGGRCLTSASTSMKSNVVEAGSLANTAGLTRYFFTITPFSTLYTGLPGETVISTSPHSRRIPTPILVTDWETYRLFSFSHIANA